MPAQVRRCPMSDICRTFQAKNSYAKQTSTHLLRYRRIKLRSFTRSGRSLRASNFILCRSNCSGEGACSCPRLHSASSKVCSTSSAQRVKRYWEVLGLTEPTCVESAMLVTLGVGDGEVGRELFEACTGCKIGLEDLRDSSSAKLSSTYQIS